MMGLRINIPASSHIISIIQQRQPRIKIYRDANGMPKGDGLVTFLKEPSVDLAIQLLDGTAFRYGLKVGPEWTWGK